MPLMNPLWDTVICNFLRNDVMGRIIIVMQKTEDAKRLGAVLKDKGIPVDDICSSGAEVLELLSPDEGGVVVSGYSLSDMTCTELQVRLPKNNGMIVLVAKDKWDMCSDDVTKVELPLKVDSLVRTIESVSSRIEASIRKGGKGPGGRTDSQQKIVERAQSFLMENKGMNKVEAYRYIQKQSMNSGNSMVEVAKTILGE